MQTLSRELLTDTANKLIEYHRQASLLNEWTFFVDGLLSAELKQNRVLPIKNKLQQMLSRNGGGN